MADAQSDLCPLEIVFLSRFCAIDNEALNKVMLTLETKIKLTY